MSIWYIIPPISEKMVYNRYKDEYGDIKSYLSHASKYQSNWIENETNYQSDNKKYDVNGELYNDLYNLDYKLEPVSLDEVGVVNKYIVYNVPMFNGSNITINDKGQVGIHIFLNKPFVNAAHYHYYLDEATINETFTLVSQLIK